MRRLAAALACAVVAAFAAMPASASAPPGHLLVNGYEYSLTLSRAKLDPGTTIVQFVNNGEDAHDLKLKRIGSDNEKAIGVVPSQGNASIQVRLRKGARYRMWCSLTTPVDHRANGMEASFRVRKNAG
jgi:plastocyanin